MEFPGNLQLSRAAFVGHKHTACPVLLLLLFLKPCVMISPLQDFVLCLFSFSFTKPSMGCLVPQFGSSSGGNRAEIMFTLQHNDSYLYSCVPFRVYLNLPTASVNYWAANHACSFCLGNRLRLMLMLTAEFSFFERGIVNIKMSVLTDLRCEARLKHKWLFIINLFSRKKKIKVRC